MPLPVEAFKFLGLADSPFLPTLTIVEAHNRVTSEEICQ